MVTRSIPVKAINHHLHGMTLPYQPHNRARLEWQADNQQVLSCKRQTRLITVMHCAPIDWVAGGAPPLHALLLDLDRDLRHEYGGLFIYLSEPEV